LNASHGPWNSHTNSAIISQPIICIMWMYRLAARQFATKRLGGDARPWVASKL
jgi:hypothetical protein